MTSSKLKEADKLTYGKIICKPRVLFASLTAGTCFLAYGSLESTLSLRLEEYGLSQLIQGCIFGIQPVLYMLGTFLAPCLIPKWVEIRVTLIVCLFGLGLGTFLIGPFYTEMSLSAMLGGLVVTGCFLGPLIIPNMSEMMHATALAYPHCDMDHANSLLSGMLNCSFGLGQAMGPLAGSILF